MMLLMCSAALAGCLGSDDEEKDDETTDEQSFGSDGGYTYVSDVQVYADMAADVCDIKDLVETFDWAGIKTIYQDGANVEKSDGSMKTLAQHAAADGKKHGLSEYYATAAPLDDYMMAALDGTGMFEGASDAMREQAVEKAAQNQILTAYAIHELNSAIDKAADGNWGTDGAQHAWDEGWALYHGSTDHASCAPYATGDKRAGNFGTTVSDTDSTAKANAAILVAMNEGLVALQAEDLAGATAARDTVVKNIVIIYSQATIRYASKMTTDTTLEAAQTHQAEGYSFWRVIESMVHDDSVTCYNADTDSSSADDAATCAGYMYMTDYDMGDGQDICYNMVSHTVSSDDNSSCGSYGFYENQTLNDGQDICYNMVSHTVSSDDNSSCGSYGFYENQTLNDGQDICYNMVSHTVSADSSNSSCSAYMYLENYTMQDGSSFTGCYNSVTHTTDANMSQAECEAFGWYENYGATVTDYCYNMVSHAVDYNMSEAECGAFAYYVNWGATVTDYCYNMVSHAVDYNMSEAECGAFAYYLNWGATMFTGCYNTVTHATDSNMTEATCGAFHYGNHATLAINHLYDFNNLPVEGKDYETTVRAALQPTWDRLGITSEDIGSL